MSVSLDTDHWWQWIKWQAVYENSILFIQFTKVFTKVNSFEAKLIQILNWYVALDFTETPRYSKCEICYFSLFFLEKWNKIITLKRFRGFSIPSQYSMTLSKRFEWHWSHEWSTKLETILLLEYCAFKACTSVQHSTIQRNTNVNIDIYCIFPLKALRLGVWTQ